MATEKLYYQDAYLRSFSATVLSCVRGKTAFEVVLDRSAFYPEGGGQPGDTGTLGGVTVLDTHERDGAVLHYCAEPLETGIAVEGHVDWERRFDFMQQHSGEHIVSGILHRLFGCDNVGFHMGAELVTIDFNADISYEQLMEVERQANEAIWSNLPLQISWPSPEERKSLPYRSKKELSGDVRIVSCPGYDICACCGTHVRASGEVGLIKLLSVQRFREGVRIEMAAGRRAYEHSCRIAEQNRQTSMLLSAKATETHAAVKRLHAEHESLRYRLVGLEDRLFARKAEEFRDRGDVLLFEEGLSPDGVRRLCAAVLESCGGRCAVFSGSDGDGYKYALGQAGGDLRQLTKDMNAALSGRGGGKPFFSQGSVAASKDEILAFFS